MNLYDLIGFLGIILGIVGVFAVGKTKKLVLFLISTAIILVYTFIHPSYPFIFLFLLLEGYFIYEIIKLRKSRSTIKLIEVAPENSYIQEFIDNYKRDIYNIFPFYNYSPDHKCFLIMREMNLVGILIGKLENDVFEIEIDYMKPLQRDLEVGNYIYKINPGYFKKMGVKTLKTKPFHKGHIKYLKKMGFNETIIDGQMYYIKKID